MNNAHRVLTERAVALAVTTLRRVNATVGQSAVSSALELRAEASVRLAVGLVRLVAAVRLAVAKQRRMDAVGVLALELAGHAGERRAVGRLVRPIAAVVLFQ